MNIKNLGIVIGSLFIISSFATGQVNVNANTDSSVAPTKLVADKTGNTYIGNYFFAANAKYRCEYDYDEKKDKVAITGFPNGSLTQSSPSSANKYSVRQKAMVEGREVNVLEPRMKYGSSFDKPNKGIVPTSQDNIANPKITYTVGQEKSILVTNIETDRNYNINIKVVATGEHCVVWTEYGDSVNAMLTNANGEEVAKEFDEKIYDMMLEYYGDFWDVDGDGKLGLVYYDIQDGYTQNSGGYVAGYFWGADTVAKKDGGNGNEMDFLNLDTYPAIASGKIAFVNRSYDTIVHEMSHCISFGQENQVLNNDHSNDTWIEEGIAESASQTYQHFQYGEVYTSRIGHYNEDRENAHKNNEAALTIWNSTLENYDLSFLFFQYIRLLTQEYEWGGYKIFKNLHLAHKYEDNLFTDFVLPKLAIDHPEYVGYKFADLLIDFKIAMTINAPEGKYGFQGEEGFVFNQYLNSGTSTSMVPGTVYVKKYANVTAYNKPAATSKDAIVVGIVTVDSPYLVINSPEISMRKAETMQLKIEEDPSLPAGNVIWSVNDETRATIDQTGLVTAKNTGNVIITAKLGNLQTSYTLKINEANYTIDLKETEITIKVGKQFTFTPVVTPDFGANASPILWTSNDSYLASISEFGVVTAKNVGNTYITASLGSTTVACDVIIEAADPVGGGCKKSSAGETGTTGFLAAVAGLFAVMYLFKKKA